MVELITGQLLPYIIGGIAALAALWGYGKKKHRDGYLQRSREQREAEQRQKGKVNEALHDAPADADDARDFLRNRKR